MKYFLLPIFIYFNLLNLEAQHIDSKLAETNQFVLASTEVGDTLYIGGDFTRIYSNDNSSKFGGAINLTTGLISGGSAKPNGTVYAAIPDGHNGFYIGGDFTQVGDSLRSRLAHIDSTGNVTSKLMNIGTSGPVKALALLNDTLCFGGTFTTCGMILNGSAGVCINQNGNLRKNFPAVNGNIICVVADGKGGWYMAGAFTKVGDFGRNGFAHIDQDGNVYPAWTSGISGSIIARMAPFGNTLYISGNFTSVNGIAHNGIAALDISTGNLLSFDPNLSGSVSDMVIYNNTLYICGSIYSIGGQTRNNLASVNLISGTATAWAPVANSQVSHMSVLGNRLFITGGFTTMAGLNRYNLAGFDLTTGNLLSWNPNSTFNNSIYALTTVGNKVIVGGQFTSIGNHLIAFDANTAAISSWNPTVDGTVYNLASNGNTVFISGLFSNVGSSARAGLAAVDTSSGNCLPAWVCASPGTLNGLCVSGSQLFVGGYYSSTVNFGGQACLNLLSVNTTTGMLTNWTPNPNGPVMKLLFSSLGTLYVSGSFSSLKSVVRNNIAALDIRGDSLLSWNPNANSSVNDFGITGNTLYACGGFTQLGGQSHAYLASINLSTGLAASWNPAPDQWVRCMSISGSRMYVSGYFNTIAGQSRVRLASFDLNSGNLTPWVPVTNNQVASLLAIGNSVYVGGYFDTIAGQPRTNIAIVDTSYGYCTPWSTFTDDWVYCFAPSSTALYAGGQFKSFGGVTRNHIASIIKSTGLVTSWNPNFNGSVYGLAAVGNKIYVGGSFTQAGTFTRNNAAAIDRNSGSVLPWDPNLNNAMSALFPLGSTVYIGGSFSTVNGTTRNYLASVDSLFGTVSAWNPNCNSNVSAFAASGTTLYVCGRFSFFSSTARYQVAAFDLATGNLTSWNPTSSFNNYYVASMVLDGTKLYVGGNFTYMGGQTRSSLAVLSTVTGLAGNWAPNLTGGVIQLRLLGKKMYIGGNFNTINNSNRNYLASTDTITGALNNWDPNVGNVGIQAMSSLGPIIYAGGLFNTIGGFNRYNIAGIDPEFGISIDTIPVTPYCIGSDIPVKFSFDPVARAGNIFKVQLSDTLGSFTNPLVIATQTGVVGGTIHCTVPSNILTSGNYRVRVISTNPALISNDNGYNLFIKAAPQPKVGYTANTYAQCVNASPFLFTDTSSITSGTLSRTWNLGDNSTVTNNPVSKTYTAGTYQLKLVVVSDQGCTDSVTKIITVYPKPNVGFNINNSSQCFNNNNFLFTDTSTILSGTIQHLWRFSNGDTAVPSVVSKTFSTYNTYTVKLMEKSNFGCQDSTSSTVNVLPNPKSGFTINNNTQCVNENNFLFNDTSIISSGTLSRIWNFGNGNADTSSLISTNKIYTATNTYSVKLIVVAANSCKDSITKTVYVNPKPGVGFTINNPVQCVNGNSFIVSDTSKISSGSMQRSWLLSTGDTSSVAGVAKTFGAPGSYSVKLNMVSNFGCKDSVSKNVTVNPSPQAAFYVNQNAQCLKGNLFLFADSTKINSGTTIGTWSFGDSTTSANPIKTYLKPGNYIVQLTEVSNNNCRDSSTTSIAVYKQTNAGFTTNTDIQCLRNYFVFTDTTTSGNFTITWKLGDGTSSSTHTTIKSYDSGMYQIKLITTTDHNCVDTVQKQITVLPYPTPLAGFKVNSAVQCFKGNNFIFTDTTSISSGTFTRKWDLGDITASTDSSPAKSYSSASTYLIKLVTISNNNCRDSVTKSITVNPQPGASVSASGATTFCFGKTVSLNCNNGVGLTYQWMNDTMNIFGVSTSTFSPVSSGNYKVRVTNLYGCEDTSNIISVIVNPLPVVGLIIGATSAQVGDTSMYTAISQTGVTYAWSTTNGNIQSGQGTNTVNVKWISKGTGTLKLFETNINSCTDSSIVIVSLLNTGIEEIQSGTFLLYPNPAQGELIIKFSNKILSGSGIVVTDVLGRTVIQHEVIRDTFEIILPVSDLKPGAYFITVQTGDTISRMKFVKE